MLWNPDQELELNLAGVSGPWYRVGDHRPGDKKLLLAPGWRVVADMLDISQDSPGALLALAEIRNLLAQLLRESQKYMGSPRSFHVGSGLLAPPGDFCCFSSFTPPARAKAPLN